MGTAAEVGVKTRRPRSAARPAARNSSRRSIRVWPAHSRVVPRLTGSAQHATQVPWSGNGAVRGARGPSGRGSRSGKHPYYGSCSIFRAVRGKGEDEQRGEGSVGTFIHGRNANKHWRPFPLRPDKAMDQSAKISDLRVSAPAFAGLLAPVGPAAAYEGTAKAPARAQAFISDDQIAPRGKDLPQPAWCAIRGCSTGSPRKSPSTLFLSWWNWTTCRQGTWTQ